MRNARLAAVAVLPALLLAAACSSGSSSDKHGGSDSSPSASSVLSGKVPLSVAQLSKALVTDTDVPGWVIQVGQTNDGTATTPPAQANPDDPGAQSDSSAGAVLTADKPACQPLADITSTKPKIHRMASVGAAFAKTSATSTATPAEINQMLIASHAPGDAQKVMDAVQTALADCKSFNAMDGTGTKTPFSIGKGPAVKVGDASVAYVMNDTADKKTGAALVTVVRTGDTITSYISVKSAGGIGALPLAVAQKEDQKLKAALATRK
jgi:hypothetical protein